MTGSEATSAILVDGAPIRSTHAQRRRKQKRGFTLVEMLVVLTIIGLIAGIVGPRVLAYVGQAREKSAELQVNAMTSALDLFYVDTGRYPTKSEGLQALVTKPANINNWNGPYLRDGKVPLDPWGGEYSYNLGGPNGPVQISSQGLASAQSE